MNNQSVAETNLDWKGNARNKGKHHKKRARPQVKSNKENAMPSKKFNASDRGQGF